MSEKTTKKGVAVRDFHDDGTNERFEEGKAYDIEAGAHANYLHAGLIREQGDTAAAGEDPTA